MPEMQMQQEEEYRGYAPQMPMLTNDRSFLAGVTDPSKLLTEIEHHLKGEKKDAVTGKWKEVRHPIANQDGIGSMLIKITTLVNQNTILSSLSESEVKRFMLTLAREIRLFIACNYERFKIAESDLTTAKNIMLYPIWFSLKRALNEGERRFLSKTLQEHHTQTIATTQKRRNPLAGIIDMGGR